jgi:hypothetical protein
MHSHTLIIGGTGMLTDAAVALASTTSILTSVARTQTSLKALDAKLKDFAGTHHLVQLNWANRSHFLDSLSAHIKQVGIPSRVVAWLHDDDFGPEVARLCSSQTQPCDFFQVRGSTAADPYIEATRFTARFDSLHGVTFHQVILGFIRYASARSSIDRGSGGTVGGSSLKGKEKGTYQFHVPAVEVVESANCKNS